MPTQTRPTRALTAQESVDQARTRMRAVGPGYTGSVWSAPGSYTEARPMRAPGTAPAPGANAPVGSAAQPSPNPTAPIRMGTAMKPVTPTGTPSGMQPRPPTLNVTTPQPVGNQAGQINLAPGSAPTARSAPIAPAPQTEANNPLSGTETTQMQGTTSAVNPGRAMGFTQRGSSVPRGADAVDANVGGTGLYARRFSNPQSASVYDSYVKRLFGE